MTRTRRAGAFLAGVLAGAIVALALQSHGATTYPVALRLGRESAGPLRSPAPLTPPEVHPDPARLAIDKAAANARRDDSHPAGLRVDGAGTHTAVPLLGASFPAVEEYQWTPSDGALAVSDSYVVVGANEQIGAYALDGTLLASARLSDWIEPWDYASHGLFDPRALWRDGHWIFVVSDDKASDPAIWVMVSRGSNPFEWWGYRLSVGEPTNLGLAWADQPRLGASDNALWLTWDEYSPSSLIVGYQWLGGRFTALPLADMAAGLPVAPVIVTTPEYCLSPAVCLSQSTDGYAAVTDWGGGGTVRLYHLAGGPSAPRTEAIGTASVPAYGLPPDAPQYGSVTYVETGDCRMSATPVWRDGVLHAAWTTAASYTVALHGGGGSKRKNPQITGGNTQTILVSAVEEAAISTTTATTVAGSITYAPSQHRYYPALTVDATGRATMVAGESSPMERVGVEVRTRAASDTAWSASTLAALSEWSVNTGRWGDYNAASLAPDGSAWTMASRMVPGTQWPLGAGWQSWIAQVPASGVTAVNSGGLTELRGVPATRQIADGIRMYPAGSLALASMALYDVTGRRVLHPTRGLYLTRERRRVVVVR